MKTATLLRGSEAVRLIEDLLDGEVRAIKRWTTRFRDELEAAAVSQDTVEDLETALVATLLNLSAVLAKVKHVRRALWG